MRLTGLGRWAALVAGLVAAVACDVAFAQKDSETINKTVAFPANGTLTLHNFSGDVRITAGSGRDVVIKAVREADRDRLDHIKLQIETSGSTVSIEANKRDETWSKAHTDNNVVHTTFDIQVPASAKIDIDVFSSDVTVGGVTGPLSVESFSGGVGIDARAAGATPHVNVHTFSGTITARLADSTKGAVSFSSFSGQFDSEIPLAVQSMGRSGNWKSRPRETAADGGTAGAVEARHASPLLSFSTFSGNVKVTK